MKSMKERSQEEATCSVSFSGTAKYALANYGGKKFNIFIILYKGTQVCSFSPGHSKEESSLLRGDGEREREMVDHMCVQKHAQGM